MELNPSGDSEEWEPYQDEETRKRIQKYIRERRYKMRILLLGCSSKKAEDVPEMPAVDRYTGVAYGVLRKYLSEGGVKPVVWILSAEYGLITGDTPIKHYDRLMSRSRAEELKKGTLNQQLIDLVEALPEKPTEVFGFLGEVYRKALNLPTIIETIQEVKGWSVAYNYAGGVPAEERGENEPPEHSQNGIGRMLADLKEWLGNVPPVKGKQQPTTSTAESSTEDLKPLKTHKPDGLRTALSCMTVDAIREKVKEKFKEQKPQTSGAYPSDPNRYTVKFEVPSFRKGQDPQTKGEILISDGPLMERELNLTWVARTVGEVDRSSFTTSDAVRVFQGLGIPVYCDGVEIPLKQSPGRKKTSQLETTTTETATGAEN